MEERVVRKKKGEEEEGVEEEKEEISKEKIGEAIRNIKDGKAAGIDEIPNEIWKYGGTELEEWVWDFCNRISRGEGWLEEWREGVLVPIIKKGEGKEVDDYRGVTLMSSLYKIYATVLSERLRKEIEDKGIISPNQTGFTKRNGNHRHYLRVKLYDQ